jgi:hypothetical protein
VSAFTPNVQHPFVSGKPKDRKRGTAKKALISRTLNGGKTGWVESFA